MATAPLGQPSSRTIDFSGTRAELLRARHLPGIFYTSPEIFALEVERIFMKEWVCVGRVEQYAEPGDYRALRIAGEPLLICKDGEGRLNAFANVCQHRGVEIIQGQGNVQKFTCPYHAWTYTLDGRLAGAPHSREVQGYDFRSCQLPRLRLESWAGYLFVNFDPDARSLADYLGDDRVEECAGFLHAEQTRIADEYTFEVECNWKFIPENLMDMYHVGVIHGSSFGAYFPVQNFDYRLQKHGYHAEYESLTMAPGGAWLFETMPWLQEKSKHFAFTVFIPPSYNMFARPDMLQPWFAHPISPTRTRITILTQYPESHFALPAFAEKHEIVKDFIRLVANEDLEMLRSLQNGVSSRQFRPGPTVRLEKAIHHLLNRYLDRLLGAGSTELSLDALRPV
jgi:Rieske 2Fe-2S family protein